MNKLVAEILKSLKQNFSNNISITIALSGGVDSIALLHVLYTIITNKLYSNQIQLDAIHINHGLSPNADNWTTFCEQLCNSLNIKLTIAKHNIIKTGGESLENNARKIRYEEFYRHQTKIIALAHHKTDQVETALTQIFRGSDLHNIAAMRTITNKNNKTFWRPFLNVTKQEIEEYVKYHNLLHIVDESNQDNQYLRNFIRNKIIPELCTWDANIEAKILKINEQIQNVLSLIDEVAAKDLESCIKNTTQSNKEKSNAIGHLKEIKINQASTNAIDINRFKDLSLIRQNNLISYFILQQNKPLPSNKQISEFVRQLNTSRLDKRPALKLNNNFSIILHKKHIFIQENVEEL